MGFLSIKNKKKKKKERRKKKKGPPCTALGGHAVFALARSACSLKVGSSPALSLSLSLSCAAQRVCERFFLSLLLLHQHVILSLFFHFFIFCFYIGSIQKGMPVMESVDLTHHRRRSGWGIVETEIRKKEKKREERREKREERREKREEREKLGNGQV